MPRLTTWQVVRPLYTDEAIKLLNEKFVCFAPGWYINTKDDVYQAAWKRFYVAKSLPDEGTGWLRGTQLVLMTSSGRLLTGPSRIATAWPRRFRKCSTPTRNFPKRSAGPRPWTGEHQAAARRRRPVGWC